MTFAREARPVVGFSYLRMNTISITVKLSWKMPGTMHARQKWLKSDGRLKKLNVKMLSESFTMSHIFISLCLSASPYFSHVVFPFLVLLMKLHPREAAAPCSGGTLHLGLVPSLSLYQLAGPWHVPRQTSILPLSLILYSWLLSLKEVTEAGSCVLLLY